MSIPTGVPLSDIPGVTPNFINPPSLAPTLITVNSVFLALMLISLSIRVYIKGIVLCSLD